MRVAVVSDTHGHYQYTLNAIRLLEGHNVQVVLHCGDIGGCEIVPLFASWPTHFVLGNVDHFEAQQLAQAIAEAGQTFHGRFGELELAGTKIALLHSDDESLFQEVTRSGKYDLVCYGHTHLAKQQHIGRTLVLNPGALYRATPHSLAIVDLPQRNVAILPVE